MERLSIYWGAYAKLISTSLAFPHCQNNETRLPLLQPKVPKPLLQTTHFFPPTILKTPFPLFNSTYKAYVSSESALPYRGHLPKNHPIVVYHVFCNTQRRSPAKTPQKAISNHHPSRPTSLTSPTPPSTCLCVCLRVRVVCFPRIPRTDSSTVQFPLATFSTRLNTRRIFFSRGASDRTTSHLLPRFGRKQQRLSAEHTRGGRALKQRKSYSIPAPVPRSNATYSQWRTRIPSGAAAPSESEPLYPSRKLFACFSPDTWTTHSNS